MQLLMNETKQETEKKNVFRSYTLQLKLKYDKIHKML